MGGKSERKFDIKFFQFLKNNKIVIAGSLLWLLFSMSMLVVYKNEWQVAMVQPQVVYTEGKTRELTGTEGVLLEDGKNVSQKIRVKSNEMQGISLYLDTTAVEHKELLKVELQKGENGDKVHTWTYDLNQENRSGFFDFGLEKPMKIEEGEEFIINFSVESEGEVQSRFIEVEKDFDTETALAVDGTQEDEIVPYRVTNGNYANLKFFAFAFYIGGSLAILGICVLLVKKKPLEWMFVGCALVLGILYLFVIPPFVVPDEPAHFVTVYEESSQILGEPTSDAEDNILVEKDAWGNRTTVSREAYMHFMQGTLGKIDSSDEMVSTRTSLSKLHPGYIPQVLGVTLARMLDMNGAQLVLLGRVFALLWYCFIMFWALRFIPIGKVTLFIIGIFPMTMQQVVSYNYDSVLFGVCFFLFAYLFRLIYEDEKLKWTNILIIACIVVAIASIKFVYLPILILALFIPCAKFGGKKKKSMVACGTILLGGIVSMAVKLSAVQGALSSGSAPGGTKVSLDYCLNNLGAVIQIFYRTLERRVSEYFSQMIASPLGWLEIGVPSIIIIALTVILLLSLIQRKEENYTVSAGMRWTSIITFAGVSAVIIMVLFLDHTSVHDTLIQGVQGRYFLPILPMIIVMLQNNNITIKKRIDHYLILFSVYLNCMTLYFVTLVGIGR